MLLYTPAARKSSQNIRADIELIITQIRRAFSASALGGNFSLLVQLVHSGEVNYVEPPPPDGTMAKDLDLLTGKTDPDNPVFKQIRALRDERRAHVVHMLINKRPNDGCGIGWGPAAQMRAVAINRTFSVSDRQCALGNFSAVHEIGHNLGLHHDRYVVPKAKVGPEEFNYGFINMQEGVRSLMAYTDQCTAEKKSCRRVLQLSSPNIRIGGTPFGRPIRDAMAANNVEVLCRSAPMATKLR